MAENILHTKSLDFAVRIVNLSRYLTQERNEYVLYKQILRSGTSIGANVSETINAQSYADFISKMNIALKEADETKYWLELLNRTNYISDEIYESLLKDCRELAKMLNSIVKTSKENRDATKRK